MLRSYALLFFVLTSGTAANPVNPWEKLTNEAVQKGWITIDDKGMASWGEEVEPPEDMDKTSFDIDPSMKIWKKLQTGQSEQYRKAEDDVDDLHHPPMENLMKAYEANKPDAPPVVDEQAQDGERKHFEPEEDLDDIYHSEIYQYLAPLEMGYKGEPVIRPVHSEPERDEDAMYHADANPGLMMGPQLPKVGISIQARLHREPEKDMDDVYHKDPPEAIFYNSDVQPAAAVEWPNVRKHTRPEEDLDHIYHQ